MPIFKNVVNLSLDDQAKLEFLRDDAMRIESQYNFQDQVRIMIRLDYEKAMKRLSNRIVHETKRNRKRSDCLL